MIRDPLAVFLILAAIVFVAILLEERSTLFRSLGAALVGILLAMLLSNIGVLPGNSPAYEFLVGPALSAGVVLILLSVDFRSVLQAGPQMLAAFAIGAVGTATGAVIGAFVLSGSVGPETWKLAGQFTGTYTGGGMNFAALGQALETSSDLFTAAIAADVLVTAVWMIACLSAPLLLGKGRAAALEPAATDPIPDSEPISLERALYNSGRPVALRDTAALAMIAVGAIWFAGRLASLFAFLPEVLWLTSIALIIAQVPGVKRLTGGAMWGNYLVLLFLASNGAQSVIANILKFGPAVVYYAVAVVAVHGVVIFGVGRAFRIDLATLTVASQANVGGPASAMALASARGYADRLLPGVAVGLLGYAIGNYAGFAIALLIRSVLAA